jgi:hypothetical protein
MILLALTVLGSMSLVSAADPPEGINYQGVLRNSADEPLGVPTPVDVSMTFRFFDAFAGGNEILCDTHDVTVSGGLFNTTLGESTKITDCMGAGNEVTLLHAFAGNTDLYLEVEVDGETLAPRTPVAAAGYALNARHVRGREVFTDGPLELYVDGTSGNDANDGLSPETAKASVQAAVDEIPAVLTADVTVHVEPGTYAERLRLTRRTRVGGAHWIRLIGDPDGYPNPGVVLDGTGLPTDPDGLEDAVIVMDVFTEIAGFTVKNFSNESGFAALLGAFLKLRNCRSEQNEIGLLAAIGSAVEVENSHFTGNFAGVSSEDHGSIYVGSNTVIVNNTEGADAEFNSLVEFIAPCTITNNDSESSAQSTIAGWSSCTLTNSTCVPIGTGECI